MGTETPEEKPDYPEQDGAVKTPAAAAEEAGDESKDEGKAEEEGPALDHRLMAAAARAGLDEDDMKALGPRAETVLHKLADGFDAISTQFAGIGRAAVAPEATSARELQQAGASPPGTESGQAARTPTVVSLEALQEAVGEDLAKPLHETVIAPLDAAIRQVQTSLESVASWIQQQETERALQVVNTFFKGIEDAYGNVYGREGQVTPRQQRARQEVVGLADEMLLGAAARGVPLAPAEALERAVYLHQRQQDTKRRVSDGVASIRSKTREVGAKPTSRGQKAPSGLDAQRAVYQAWRRRVGL